MTNLRIAVEGRLSELSDTERGILLDRSPSEASSLVASVAEILADVRDRGDRALLDMAARFDGVEMEAAELYTLAARYGRRALAVLTVSDQLQTGEALPPEDRERTFGDKVENALQAAFSEG